MTEFPEWSTVARDPLILPIKDTAGVVHRYTIPSLGYLDEIRMREVQRVVADRMKPPSETDDETTDPDGETSPPASGPDTGMSNEEFLTMLLGDALAQMRADNVPVIAITHAAAVAHADATLGREVALFVWQKGLDPKALTADLKAVRKAMGPTNRATRRSAAKKTAKKITR